MVRVGNFSFPNPDAAALQAVLAIDAASYAEPFSISQLRQYLTSSGVVLRLFRHPAVDGEIVGFCLHRERSHSLYLARLAVSPMFRRRGFGSRLLQPLLNDYRGRVCTAVCETNLDGQLFLKRHRFYGKLMPAAAASGMRDEIAMVFTAPHLAASENGAAPECGK